MEEQMSIKIPGDIYKKLESYLNKTAFGSVEKLAVYILNQYMEQKKDQNLLGATPDESEEIKRRLKNLGYL